MNARRVTVFLAWAAAAILPGCVDQATETTNPPTGLHGRLVDGQGRGVAGATVKLYRVESVPLKRSAAAAFDDSARTDARGYYALEDMRGGDYNVLGSYNEGGLMVLIPGIAYDSAFASVDLGTDTLRIPGQIKGQVTSGGAGKAGIFCYVPGTSFLSISDDQGKFWIYAVPQGRYEVRYRYPGYETLVDSGVVVRSGEITELAPRDIGPDTAFPPPAPAALQAAYDTLGGSVLLRWTAAGVPDLDGYVVYRIDSASSAPVRISAGLVRDTVYGDTLYRDAWDTLPRRVTYRVKSQDRDANLSATFSPAVSVNAVPPAMIRTSIGFTVRTPFGDTVVMADTVRLIAGFASPLRGLSALTWTVDGVAVRTVRLGGKTGTDTLVRAFPREGIRRVAVAIEDEGGAIWRDSLEVAVLRDAPLAFAGREASIAAGVPALLTGRGVDRFGTIVQYAWDFDMDGAFDDSSALTGDVARTYPSEGPQRHVLRVRDDDGNHGYDTLGFTVGGLLLGDVYTHDLHLKKSGSPYSIQGNNVMAQGTLMRVDPGVTLRFGAGARLTIRGTLICEGTATDSIVMDGSADSTRFPEDDFSDPAIHFLDAPGSVVLDTTHVSGSRLRYVRFHALKGIGMEGTVVTIEDCTFHGAIGRSVAGIEPGIVSLAQGRPDNDRWIFRRNTMQEARGRAISAMLDNYYPLYGHPRLHVYIQGNTLRGSAGISIRTEKFTQGLVAIEGNVFSLSAPPEGGPDYAIQYDGLRPAIIRDNLITGASRALSIWGSANVEIAHNEITGCRIAFQDGGFKGRFHHNRVGSGLMEMEQFMNAGSPNDSNSFGTGVALEWINLPKPVQPLDLRNNWWSTTDLLSIRRALGMTVHPEAVLLDPILAGPPPGAGRRRPVPPTGSP